MISPALLATLTNLKNNRLLSSRGKVCACTLYRENLRTLPLAFVSAARSFGNPFDPAYDDGRTLASAGSKARKSRSRFSSESEENDRSR